MRPVAPEMRRMVLLLYVAAGIVLLEELLEILALVYPFDARVASWRFGLLGVTVSRMASFALADALILGVALALNHLRFLRILGVLHFVGALALLPAVALTGLDWLVLRRAIKPEFVRGFDLTAGRTFLMCGLACLTGFLVFWFVLRMRVGRWEREERVREVLISAQPAKGYE